MCRKKAQRQFVQAVRKRTASGLKVLLFLKGHYKEVVVPDQRVHKDGKLVPRQVFRGKDLSTLAVQVIEYVIENLLKARDQRNAQLFPPKSLPSATYSLVENKRRWRQWFKIPVGDNSGTS